MLESPALHPDRTMRGIVNSQITGHGRSDTSRVCTLRAVARQDVLSCPPGVVTLSSRCSLHLDNATKPCKQNLAHILYERYSARGCPEESEQVGHSEVRARQVCHA